MCQVHNEIACLTALKRHLEQHGVDDFQSVKQVLQFKDSFSLTRTQTRLQHEQLVRTEQQKLLDELQRLETYIHRKKQNASAPKSTPNRESCTTVQTEPGTTTLNTSTWVKYPLQSLTKLPLQIVRLCRQIRVLTRLAGAHIRKKQKQKRLNYLTQNFNEAVEKSGGKQMKQLDYKKRVVDESTGLIYGALGEHKVANELRLLPDDNVLINDFSLSFREPIFRAETGEQITSIQIDHMLVAPCGIFIIETKNWSRASLQNRSLHSPVAQIRRSSFAVYRLLQEAVAHRQIALDAHHWGGKKIPIFNLIALTNNPPAEQFQWVKILKVEALRGYIQYFPPVFSTDETTAIAQFLLQTLRKQRRNSKTSDQARRWHHKLLRRLKLRYH